MLRLARWKIILVALSLVFGVLFSLPNVLPQSTAANLPGLLQQRLNLGLDLQGGSYLLLEVDTAALRRERLSNLLEDVRNTLRTERIAYTGLTLQGTTVSARITDPGQVERAREVLNQLGGAGGAPGATRSLDVSVQDQTVRAEFQEAALVQAEGQAIEQSIEIIRRRVDELGTREPSITRQGRNRIVVQAPGESDPEQLKRVIGQTAKLTFQMLDETVSAAEVSATGRAPPGSILLPQPDDPSEPFVLVKRRALVSGENLVDAQVGFDQTGKPAIDFRFDGAGARRFGAATSQNIGKRFAIVLDEKVISAPVIQGAITGGSGQITGGFDQESASELAGLLRAGALPAPLTFEEQRTVGAELGQDAIDAGRVSTVIAFASVLVFMVLAYGFLFGGISVIALLINGLLIIAAMSLTQATLTLPGIAGLILTLAVAVDANVLIYERMRDEVRAGRSPALAMEGGFSRAMETILDANVTTLVAALIMFVLGSGPVKGFAWTLSIGVFTTVFTAVLVTQVLLGWWFRAAKPKSLPIV